jgi:hypothetical protein
MIAQTNTENLGGDVATAVTNPSGDHSAGQANSPPGEVLTVVNLPSQDSAW